MIVTVTLTVHTFNDDRVTGFFTIDGKPQVLRKAGFFAKFCND